MNELNYTIEVIIPFHRVDVYLEKAITSVLSSKFVETRIIAVNDTGEYVRHETLGLRESDVLINTKVRGYVNALFTGVESTNEQFVTFLDSDDLMHPLRFSEQLNLLTSGQFDIVSCNMGRIDTDGHLLSSKRLLGKIPNPVNRRELWIIGSHGADSTLMCKGDILRKFWKSHGTFGAHFADYGWALSLPQSIRIGHLDESYYLYRNHPRQISSHPSLGNSWSSIYPLWESNLGIQFPGIWQKCSVTDQIGLAVAFPAALVRLSKSDVNLLGRFIDVLMEYFGPRSEIEIRAWRATLMRRAFIADRGRSIRYWSQAPGILTDLVTHQLTGDKLRRIPAR